MPLVMESREEYQKKQYQKKIILDRTYIAKITSINPEKLCQTFDSSQKRGYVQDKSTLPPEETEMKTGISVLIYANVTGDPISTVEGELVEPMTHTMFADMFNSFGFNKKNEAYPLRQFVAAAVKKNVSEQITLDGEITDLIGKYVCVRVAVNPTKKGGVSNKIIGYEPTPNSFMPDPELDAKGEETIAKIANKDKAEPTVTNDGEFDKVFESDKPF